MLENTLLGKKTVYSDKYDPSLLTKINRAEIRQKLLGYRTIHFKGFDLWNCYELSWISPTGKPVVKILEIVVSSDSEYLVESKSLKLYLNSFNNTVFENIQQVEDVIFRDLNDIFGASTFLIYIKPLREYYGRNLNCFDGLSLDNLDITISHNELAIPLLSSEEDYVHEILFSDLVRSRCPVTNQPDFASIQIEYIGNRIEHKSLLKYLISLRSQPEFHEQCIEKIFDDIYTHCAPEELTVYGRYTRRGGIDINPIRSNKTIAIDKLSNTRQVRQ